MNFTFLILKIFIICQIHAILIYYFIHLSRLFVLFMLFVLFILLGQLDK